MKKKIIEFQLNKFRALALSDIDQLREFLKCSIEARDLNALRILNSAKPLKEIYTAEDLFSYVISIVRSDKNISIIEYLIKDIGFDFSKIVDPYVGCTLLGEAALYSSEKIVKLFIQNGFNINHQDKEGSSALHNAVKAGHLNVVNELIKNKAKVNISIFQSHLTPLHEATLRNNQEISTVLIAAGADRKVKSQYGNYFELKKLIEREEIELDPISLNPEGKTISLHEAIANYCKGLFLEPNSNNRENYFTTAINKFKAAFKNPPQIPNASTSALQQNILSFLNKIYNIYKFKESDSLKKFIIDSANKYGYDAILTFIYNELGIERREKADFQASYDYGRLTELYLQKGLNSISLADQGNIYYNIGLSYKHFNLHKALEAFIKAENLLGIDQEVLVEKAQIYLRLNQLQEALSEIQKIPDEELRDLFSICVYLKLAHLPLKTILEKYQFHKLKEKEAELALNSEKYAFYLDICAEIELRGSNIEGVISIYRQTMKAANPINLPFQLCKILESYQKTMQWEAGLNFLTDIYKEFPQVFETHNLVSLNYYEFIFYEMNGRYIEADSILKNITELTTTSDIASLIFIPLILMRFYRVVEADFEQAKEILASSSLEHYSEKTKLQSLLKKIEEEKQKSPTQAETVVEDNVALLEWINEPEELETELRTFDPKAIHAYFQEKKKELAKRKIEDIASAKSSSWIIDNHVYDNKKEEVYALEDKANFYATIDSKLLSKLDQNRQDQFLSALKKELVSKAYNSIGIKFINGKLIELKINDDQRLYTSKIYKNSEGKYLIIFDNEGNHAKVKKVSKDTKLEAIEVKSYSIEASNIISEVDEADEITASLESNNNSAAYSEDSSLSQAELESILLGDKAEEFIS